jgi:hypothetical protein
MISRTVPRTANGFLAVLILSSSVCSGATIGQWSGNSSLWASSGNFSTLYTALTASGSGGPGHTVTSGQAITQQNLSRDNYFVVSNSAATMSGAEVSTLTNWVRAGGILLLFAAGDNKQVSNANAVLTSLGTGVSGTDFSVEAAAGPASSGVFTGGGLWSTDRAVSGPRNLGFSSLSWFQANSISGGNSLAMNIGSSHNLSEALRFDRFALGKVYVFGDRFDSNVLMASGGSNLHLFLNMLSQQNTLAQFNGPTGSVNGDSTPEPSSLLLTGAGIALVVLWRRRRWRLQHI